MKVLSAVLVGCFVAIVAGQAFAENHDPHRTALKNASVRSRHSKYRAEHLKHVATKAYAAEHAAKLKAAAAEYAEKGLPTVNAQEIREGAQQAVARAKSSPTNWKTWEEKVQEKMAGRKQVSTAMKGEKMHPQRAYVHAQKFHNHPGGYPGQELRQEIAAEAKKIPKTIPHQQQTLVKQQNSYPKPKTMPYPGAASRRVMQQEARSYGPGMPQWDEEKIRHFMQLSDEKKMEITKMMKEKARQSAYAHPKPPRGRGQDGHDHGGHGHDGHGGPGYPPRG